MILKLRNLLIINIILLGLIGISVSAEQSFSPISTRLSPPRYAKIEVINQDKPAITKLIHGGYDIQGMSSTHNFILIADDDDRAQLSADGIVWRELESDLSAYFQHRLTTESQDLVGGYPSYQETIDSLNLYRQQFPNLVSAPVSIGTTTENRSMYMIRVTHNPDSIDQKPQVFYNGLIHSREAITHTQLLYFIRYLISHYNTDQRVRNILDTRALYFVPLINPDGYVYNEQSSPSGGGLWRKNRAVVGGRIVGVDLNRNFDAHWGYDDIGSSSQSRSDSYRGTVAFSEPESRAIRDFCNSHRFRVTVNYHSFSNLVLYPMSYRREYTRDNLFYNNMGHRLGDPNRYQIGTPWWLLYTVNGDAIEWQYSNSPDSVKNFAFGIEVGDSTDSFWPARSRISTLCQSLIEPNLRLAEIANEPRIVLPPPVPLIISADTIQSTQAIQWSTNPDEQINPATNWDLRASNTYPTGNENFDSTSIHNWISNGVMQNDSLTARGQYAMRFANTNSTTSYLVNRYPIPIHSTDTLSYRIWYDIETDYDYFVAQISTDDGITWFSLPGNLTTTTDPNHQNWDYGITGTSNHLFVQARHPLIQYAGKSALLRLIYITDAATLNAGVWIDNVTPSLLVTEPWTIHHNNLLNASDSLPAGNWIIQIRARDAQGDTSAWSLPTLVTISSSNAISNRDLSIPISFGFDRTYPNPFNNSIAITFSLTDRANTVLSIYNTSGQIVYRYSFGIRPAGQYSTSWNGISNTGSLTSSGVYFLQLSSGQQVSHRKILLVK